MEGDITQREIKWYKKIFAKIVSIPSIEAIKGDVGLSHVMWEKSEILAIVLHSQEESLERWRHWGTPTTEAGIIEVRMRDEENWLLGAWGRGDTDFEEEIGMFSFAVLSNLSVKSCSAFV